MPKAPSAAALKGRMAISVRTLGAKESAANIRRMTKAVRQAFFEEMVKIGEAILLRSQSHYVPVLTGTLRDSGTMTATPGRYPVVEIGFGGAASAYAVIQHENLMFNHPRGGSAKYLELAVQDFEPRIKHSLDVAVRHEIQKHDMRGRTFKGTY